MTLLRTWALLLLQGWPLPCSTAVWVLTSTSGASPMTNAARIAPYQVSASLSLGCLVCTSDFMLRAPFLCHTAVAQTKVSADGHQATYDLLACAPCLQALADAILSIPQQRTATCRGQPGQAGAEQPAGHNAASDGDVSSTRASDRASEGDCSAAVADEAAGVSVAFKSEPADGRTPLAASAEQRSEASQHERCAANGAVHAALEHEPQ